MPANMENSTVVTRLEKVSFCSSPKEGQWQKMSILLYNYAHFPCYQGISFISALIPFLRALSSLHNHLQKVLPSNIITVGNRFQYVTLGKYRDVQCLWVLKDLGIRKQLQKLTMKILWVLCRPSLKNNYPNWKVLPQSSQSIRESFREKVRPELRACLGQSLSGQWGAISLCLLF